MHRPGHIQRREGLYSPSFCPQLVLIGLDHTTAIMRSNRLNHILLNGEVNFFSYNDKPVDTYSECDPEYPCEENGEHGSVRSPSQSNESSPHVENREPGSRRSTCSSTDVFEDATDSYSFEKTMPNLTVESLFISPYLYEFFESSLPNIVKGCQWILLYRYIN
ncbi:unnamed protein product [Fraxinus pennsylvanica]|uniref:Uncharacterized protein n=1 Tax=Fraxinus pennsylvanica TaxID=56036 RepID=A0AAD2A1K6_9LAMI|nr:unnamed protein product [Fraxinus pennsylvanica]